MPSNPKTTAHIYFRNNAMFCSHCGQSHTIQLPMEVDDFAKAGKAFAALHKHCKKTWQEPVPPDPATSTIAQRAAWWLEHGERGMSSVTIWQAMTTLHPAGLVEKHHPHDPDDFRRCYQLLQVVPEWKETIYMMKFVSPVWSNLADNWEKLTAMLEEQLKTQKPNGMYESMKELGC